jgi:hypothetical protein
MTNPMDTDDLVSRLPRLVEYMRMSAESSAKAQCLMAEAKTARQTDGGEYRGPTPEQTIEWEVAEALKSQSELLEALRGWRPIESAPDDELVLVWDYGSTQIAMKSEGRWISQWKGIPGPRTPTKWLPIPPPPEGAAV